MRLGLSKLKRHYNIHIYIFVTSFMTKINKIMYQKRVNIVSKYDMKLDRDIIYTHDKSLSHHIFDAHMNAVTLFF